MMSDDMTLSNLEMLDYFQIIMVILKTIIHMF
jgi:hypothetical protein